MPCDADPHSVTYYNIYRSFFIPAGAGVMLHLQRVGDEWLPITLLW